MFKKQKTENITDIIAIKMIYLMSFACGLIGTYITILYYD